MSLNKVRKLVSGNKARFVTEDGDELDLCYVTDRIIICGWPGAGVESLYRNDRAVVRKFLTSRYGTTHFRIFNFVPRFENEYDAEYFHGQVSRFPFPDHHPPPLSLIPLTVRRMQEWTHEDERNVIVIHCKAGKGRSGTMCCCYLLSLPTLPQPPTLPQNQSKSKRKQLQQLHSQSLADGLDDTNSSASSPVSKTGRDSADSSDSDDDTGSAGPPRSQSGGAAMDLAGFRGSDRHRTGKAKISKLVESMATTDTEGEQDGEDGDVEDGNPADLEALGMADKLEQIFDLHTRQRMKPPKSRKGTGQYPASSGTSSPITTSDSNLRTSSPATPVEKEGATKENLGSAAKDLVKPKRGVSIPSQRRFVRYWSRVLVKDDPRPLDLLAPPNASRIERVRRQVGITEVRVYMPDKMPGFPAILGKKRISVHLGRYRTSFVDDLERRELKLRVLHRLEKKRQKAHKTGQTLQAEEELKLQELLEAWTSWKDDDWQDKHDLFEKEGSLVEADADANDTDEEQDTRAEKATPCRILRPSNNDKKLESGLPVDADREVQLKFLIGDSGKKHSLLPDVGSLGYVWLIPSFEASVQPTPEDPASLSFTATIESTEIDFFKRQSGIEKIEVDFVWSIH